ncbi:MAG: tetratricopeptide repeat protein [Cyanobacteria bacterium P01_H01_bin.130]
MTDSSTDSSADTLPSNGGDDALQLPPTELEQELAADRRSQAREFLQRGKAAYESGRYRDAINRLEAAAGVMQNPVSPLGGEISVWLVTAYEALGLRDSALELCRKICQHPDFTVRKQARRLLEILEAPQLSRPKDWMSEIPDLSSLDEGDRSQVPVARTSQRSKGVKVEKPPEPPLPPEERRYSETWFWAIALGMLVAGLAAWAII